MHLSSGIKNSSSSRFKKSLFFIPEDSRRSQQKAAHRKNLVCGMSGYISQKLFDELLKRGLKLITGLKKNMKNKLMPILDKLLLRKRSIIETINGQLKNDFHRHRSVTGFMLNIISVLVAYKYQKKPSIQFSKEEIDILLECGVIL